MTEYSYEYYPHRGINRETFQFYDAKTRITPDGKPNAVGFKWPNGAIQVRLLDEKKVFWDMDAPRPVPGLFGRDKFAAGSHKSVTITEGAYDALSLHQATKLPVVSVQSSSSASRDCMADIDFLKSYEQVYLALDNDVHGREATAAIARLFDPNRVFDVKFTNRKDANEYTQNSEESVLRSIWWNSKRYLPASITPQSEFGKILTQAMEQGIPYPFPTLNDMTYGLRLGESVLITAQEGVGKTELMHAILFNILKETDYGVGGIFLEEPQRRTLQALAGLELQRPIHLPDRSVTDVEVLSALERVLRRDDRLYLYSHFGSGDPDVLLDTIRYLVTVCACSVIGLDHITMGVSGLDGENERKALDYLSTRLEMMVKELNFALLIVSHVNDDGLTRGSRYISKVADMRVDAKRDLLNPDPIARNTTKLTVSKNRFCGRTGPAGSLLFDPLTGLYREVGRESSSLHIPSVPRKEETKEKTYQLLVQGNLQVPEASNDNFKAVVEAA